MNAVSELVSSRWVAVTVQQCSILAASKKTGAKGQMSHLARSTHWTGHGLYRYLQAEKSFVLRCGLRGSLIY